MRDFNIEVKDKRDHNWYRVSKASFRYWKNPPSDGLNGPIEILGDDGCELLDDVNIEAVSFTIW